MARPQVRAGRAFAALLALGLGAGVAVAAQPEQGGEADADTIIACLAQPAAGHPPYDCADAVHAACQSAATDPKAAALPCERRRGAAWALAARRFYRLIEQRLDEAGRKLLRTSQVQAELEQRDLCAVAGKLAPAGMDAALAAARCASDLAADRAVALGRLATSR